MVTRRKQWRNCKNTKSTNVQPNELTRWSFGCDFGASLKRDSDCKRESENVKRKAVVVANVLDSNPCLEGEPTTDTGKLIEDQHAIILMQEYRKLQAKMEPRTEGRPTIAAVTVEAHPLFPPIPLEIKFVSLTSRLDSCRITIYKFEWKMQWLLKSQLKLLNEFYSTVLPYLYPLATEDEVDRANQFIRSVKEVNAQFVSSAEASYFSSKIFV
ncbi:hypothetical protein POM88_038709 [Heracleum sosnowskyi]|uniref:Uncharacterized protein n=1 Tax=Heracleum sosnowskyi TaxID=360622 RepID=A0AAD8HBD5_9APIA|nr:hypothetical protein POM88_038709 [Heracleum sosnowskyi]